MISGCTCCCWYQQSAAISGPASQHVHCQMLLTDERRHDKEFCVCDNGRAQVSEAAAGRTHLPLLLSSSSPPPPLLRAHHRLPRPGWRRTARRSRVAASGHLKRGHLLPAPPARSPHPTAAARSRGASARAQVRRCLHPHRGRGRRPEAGVRQEVPLALHKGMGRLQGMRDANRGEGCRPVLRPIYGLFQVHRQVRHQALVQIVDVSWAQGSRGIGGWVVLLLR